MSRTTVSDEVALGERLAFTIQLARDAGALIQQQRQQASVSIHHKAHHELVTSADLAADALIRQRIEQHYPGEALLSEESSPDLRISNAAPALWVVDPIDGTVNYAYGHAQVAVSIAWCRSGTVMLGVVHAPFSNETFSASVDTPSMCNGKAIFPSATSELSDALIATGFPYDRSSRAHLLRRLGMVLQECRDLRRLGSAALDICWVACGRLDGYYESVSPWDLAAAKLIARRAACAIDYLDPLPADACEGLYSQDVIIATEKIAPALCDLLRRA